MTQLQSTSRSFFLKGLWALVAQDHAFLLQCSTRQVIKSGCSDSKGAHNMRCSSHLSLPQQFPHQGDVEGSLQLQHKPNSHKIPRKGDHHQMGKMKTQPVESSHG